MRVLSVMVLVLALAGCRDKELSDGTYALSTGEVLRDDCHLAVQGEFARGALRTEGNFVSLTLEAPALRLDGAYRYSEEAFYVDGSLVNPTLNIGGRSCLVDTAAWHLDGKTVDPTHFEGQLSVETRSEQNTACVCTLWVGFTAAPAP